jgi:hypothetical protein
MIFSTQKHPGACDEPGRIGGAWERHNGVEVYTLASLPLPCVGTFTE